MITFLRRHSIWLAFILLAVATSVGYHQLEQTDQRLRASEERTAQLRQDRVKDQIRIDEAICHRQETVTKRLIDTKIRIIDANKVQLAHFDDVAAVQTPSGKAGLERGEEIIRKEIRGLRRGIGILKRELDSVDCENLPSSAP